MMKGILYFEKLFAKIERDKVRRETNYSSNLIDCEMTQAHKAKLASVYNESGETHLISTPVPDRCNCLSEYKSRPGRVCTNWSSQHGEGVGSWPAAGAIGEACIIGH